MMRMTGIKTSLAVVVAAGMLVASAALSEDNLDYWLHHATSKPATKPAKTGDNPTTPAATAPAGERPSRADALPGAVELSNGKILAGYLFTTAEKDWEVFVEEEKVFHRVPFIAVLSLTANVVEEGMELEWRWKEMGTPERVYTGRSYPTRRLTWTLKLIDGTSITGAIKGQPLWVEQVSGKYGPIILAERTKGEMGQTLQDLVTVKRLVVSKRMMDVLESKH
jgi:hypothetical protein